MATVPSLLSDELETNPFLRPQDQAIRAALGDSIAVASLCSCVPVWCFIGGSQDEDKVCVTTLICAYAGVAPDASDVEAFKAIRKAKDNF